jgi:hypothetical protein
VEYDVAQIRERKKDMSRFPTDEGPKAMVAKIVEGERV